LAGKFVLMKEEVPYEKGGRVGPSWKNGIGKKAGITQGVGARSITEKENQTDTSIHIFTQLARGVLKKSALKGGR